MLTSHLLVACMELARLSEGLSLTPYRDVGHWAVGYGHHLTSHQRVHRISLHQAEAYLEADVAKADAEVLDLTEGIKLKKNEEAALCDFVFNLGSSALEDSTLLRKLKRGDRQGAAAEFVKWDHSGKRRRIVFGLAKRRRAERDLFLHGVVPWN